MTPRCFRYPLIRHPAGLLPQRRDARNTPGRALGSHSGRAQRVGRPRLGRGTASARGVASCQFQCSGKKGRRRIDCYLDCYLYVFAAGRPRPQGLCLRLYPIHDAARHSKRSKLPEQARARQEGSIRKSHLMPTPASTSPTSTSITPHPCAMLMSCVVVITVLSSRTSGPRPPPVLSALTPAPRS